MRKSTLALSSAAVALAVSGGFAEAKTATARIYDATPLKPVYSFVEKANKNGPINGSWVDEIGGGAAPDGFRSGAIDVIWGLNDTTGKIESVTFKLFTNFGMTGLDAIGNPSTFIGFADLFIDVGANGTQQKPDWDYAIDFKSESKSNRAADGSGQTQRNVARLVSLDAPGIGYMTSRQVLGNVAGIEYGGLTNICAGTEASCQPNAREPETKITGNSSYDLAVSDSPGTTTINPPPGSTGTAQTYTYDYTVVLSGIDFSGWGNLRLFWGTGWCSNDSVEGYAQVPVPAALPIMAAALGGFAFVGWRRQPSALA